MEKTELNNRLREAVETTDVQKVRELLEHGADPDWYSEEHSIHAAKGKTLTIAVAMDSPDVVRLLLEHGADVNCHDELTIGFSPLSQAILQRVNPAIARTLIEFGADINSRSRNGQTSIMHLISDGILPYDELLPLVDKIEDIEERYFLTGETFLHQMRERENDDFKVKLLEKFLNAGIPVNSVDFEGDTPLHNMASIACIDSISFLVNSGADIHAMNYNGETVLHILAENSHYPNFSRCLQYLVETRIDLSAVDNDGKTALHHAAAAEDTTVEGIRELIDIGVATNVQDRLGKNEIHGAVSKIKSEFSAELTAQCIEVIKALTEVGVDINNTDLNGFVPLHKAVNKHNIEIIEAMLELGADVTKAAKCGITPLHLATLRFDVGPLLVNWCVIQELSLNETDTYGSTPLHYAVWFREESTIRYLLQKGADSTIKDSSGATPGDLAKVLQFDCFQKILETVQDLVKMEEIDTMHGNDPFEECPYTKYVFVEPLQQNVSLEEWKDHLVLHEESVAKFVYTLLHSQNMGLFYTVKENREIPALIDNLMKRLVSRLSERNPLFHCDLWLAGSVFEETKIDVPNEFDYIWCLSEWSKHFSPVESPSCPSGFVKLRLNCTDTVETHYKGFIDTDGYLDGRKVIFKMYSLLNEEILKLFLEGEAPECLMLGPLLDCSSGSLSSLSFYFCGQQLKLVSISVDVVPTFSPRNWKPSDFTVEESRVLQNLDSKPPFSIVLKTPDQNFVQAPTFYFRKSYASWEQSVIRSFPPYLRKGYIIVKALVESSYFPELVQNDTMQTSSLVTSYRLKTCFLHQLEKALCQGDVTLCIPDTDTAQQNEAALNWSMRIVEQFDEFITAGCLPSFFERTKNLLLIEGAVELVNTQFYITLVECLNILLGTQK